MQLKAFLLSAAAFSVSALADDCSDGPMDAHKTWGRSPNGNNDPAFCHTQWKQGLVVTGIEVWATQWQVKGVQMTYSDGSKAPLEGVATADPNHHQSINWDPTAPVKVLRLAGNSKGDAFGRIHIEVGGQTLDVGSDTGHFNGDDVPLASGLLLGASGTTANSMVTMWAPLFLGSTNGKAEITSIKFNDNLDDVNKQQKGIKNMVLTSTYIKNTNPTGGNDTETAQTWSFNGVSKVTTSSSLTSTTEQIFSMSESIEVGAEVKIPEVADVSVSSTTTAGYQMSSSNSNQIGKSFDGSVGTTQGSTLQGPLKAAHAMFCQTTAVQGNYDGGYVATVQITVNGKQFQLQRPGQFQGVSWMNGATECKDMLIKDIPANANNVQSAGHSKKRAVVFSA